MTALEFFERKWLGKMLCGRLKVFTFGWSYETVGLWVVFLKKFS